MSVNYLKVWMSSVYYGVCYVVASLFVVCDSVMWLFMDLVKCSILRLELDGIFLRLRHSSLFRALRFIATPR